MAIINVRSPYYISITDAAISYATLEIYIYNGTKTATTPIIYNLRKNKIGTNTKVSFEISELIRDYLDVNFNGNYDISAESNDSCKWVQTNIRAYNSAGVQVGSTITETNLALDSYGYFEEGSNFTLDNQSLLVSDSDIFLPNFGDSNVAIYTENNPTVNLLDASGTVVKTHTFASSLLSDEQIKYVSLFPELITNLGFDDTSDWALRPGDIIEDGQLYFGGAIGGRFPTTFTPITGTNYILNFTITESISGSFSVFDGDSGIAIISNISEVGDYSVQYTQSATLENKVAFFSTPGFVGAIDNVSVKEVYQVSKVSVTDDNKTRSLKVKQVADCKYQTYKVTFVNKNGVLQDMYFFKKSVDAMSTKRENYNANVIGADNTYQTNQHTKKDFNVIGNETIKLSSGFLNESANEIFKQLLLSEKVWITKQFQNDILVLPINIKTSNITYKTSLNDRLVEYSFDFENSFNVINDIR